MLPAWWDWDISARARIFSLGSAWVLVAFAWAPFGLLAPIAIARFGFSLVQTIWNHKLDHVHPLGPRNLLDWGMFVTALSMSITVAAIAEGGIELPASFAFSLVLLPLSVIQVKAVLRSFMVHQQLTEARRVVVLRLEPERELVRAA